MFIFVTCWHRLAEETKVLFCFPPDGFGYGVNESVLSCSVPNGRSSAAGVTCRMTVGTGQEPMITGA